jgi:ubiquinone biosynthesis accessory factor UbiJ
MLEFLLAPTSRLATQGLSSAINLALAKDPVARKKLHGLRNCVLELHLKNLNQSLFIAVQNERIAVLAVLKDAPKPSVRVSGNLIAFIKLATQDNSRALFQSEEIVLNGDAVRAQQILHLVETLNIDWEALIADAIGDIPAHVIGSSLKKSWAWTQKLSATLLRDLEEYVKYELRLFPSKPMAKRQFDKIDQLRLATDRLEARMKKLFTPSKTKPNKAEEG